MAAAAFSSCGGGDGFVFRDADLVFCVSESCAGRIGAEHCGGMSSAVAAATAWDDSLKFDHVAMIVLRDGEPYVLEATSSKGVALTPWEEFRHLACDMDDEGGKGLVVMRVNRDFPVKEAVERAYERLGQEYDWHFLPDNGKLYCSELIYECYREADGSPLFPAAPMNFRDSEGRMPAFWTELFDKLGEPVPEGVPGTNPNAMSKAPFLIQVHRCFSDVAIQCDGGVTGAEVLENEVRRIAESARAKVGVYVRLDGRRLLELNDSERYPMCSVFKLHQAIAVLDSMERTGTPLDSMVHVSAGEMQKNTWSPLRDRFPDRDVVISLRELLEYSVVRSDNNACDILFSRFGGPGAVDSFMRRIGLEHFRICATEDLMHKDLGVCYDNWTYPSEAVLLLEKLCEGTVLSEDSRKFLCGLLVSCNTGLDRLYAPLEGTGAVLGHKTGTGDLNSEGQIIGLNDVGYVYLPDGRRYTIAVFIKDSEETPANTAAVIAGISRAVYEFVSCR